MKIKQRIRKLERRREGRHELLLIKTKWNGLFSDGERKYTEAEVDAMLAADLPVLAIDVTIEGVGQDDQG